jgi:lipoprotein-anchoring transpeptidase ErfK/SrfK
MLLSPQGLLQAKQSRPTTLPSRMMLRRILLPLAAVAVLAPAAGTASAATDDDTAVIGAGTLVAGIDLSGQTIAQGATTLTTQLTPKLLAPVTVSVGHKRFQLGGERAGVKLDALRTARRAYIAARDAAPATPVTPAPTTPATPATGTTTTTTTTAATKRAAVGGAASGINVPVALSISRTKIRAWADKVVPRVTRQPRSATLKIGVTKMVVGSARRGVTIDAAALTKQVGDAFADPALPRDGLRQPLKALEPGVTVASLRKANGTILTVDRGTFKLRLFKNLKLVKTYGIAVGMDGLDTPAGTYSIANKEVNPAWHVPNSAWAGSLAGQVIPGGAPNNPLKARWMGIYDGVGIHGTSEDWSIGSKASHGCIRMHVSDVEDLYPRVPVGAKVLIH